MQEHNQHDSSPFKFVFSWRRFLLHCTIISVGFFIGLLTWYFSKPQTTRFFETTSEQHQNISLAPQIQVFLDANSAIAVTDSQPVQIELFKGSVYFDTGQEDSVELEVKVGGALIRNNGTCFSISMLSEGRRSNVMVIEGQVEINVATGTYLVSAGEQAVVDGLNVSEHQLITATDTAWWFADRLQPNGHIK